MGEKPEQIERQIQQERGELGKNLEELERKVKTATDWRAQFEKHPVPMLGIALGGGVLLSVLIGSNGKSHRRWSSKEQPWNQPPAEHRASEYQKRVQGTWDNIKGALFSVGTDQVRGLLDKLIPGFGEHYDRTQPQKMGSALNSPAGRHSVA